MRHTTLLLTLAAIAATSCSLQLDSQYGLRWEPKTHVGPSSERSQKSNSARGVELVQPAAPTWNSVGNQSPESFQTDTQEYFAVENQESVIVTDPGIDASPADVFQVEPQSFENVPASPTYDTPTNVHRVAPNAVAALGAALLIIAGIFGLLVSAIFIIIMGAYGASFGGVLFTLAILALSILFFVIAGNLVKSSK